MRLLGEGYLMLYKNHVIKIVALLFITQLDAVDKKLLFIDAHLDDFAIRVISSEQERAQFKVYYGQLTQKMHEAKEKEPRKERATYRYLYNLALKNLKSKHADWYQEISPFVTDPALTLDDELHEVRKVIKFFLTRYGAYEEFLNYKAGCNMMNNGAVAENSHHDAGGLWKKITSSVQSAASNVANFFGFGKKNMCENA